MGSISNEVKKKLEQLKLELLNKDESKPSESDIVESISLKDYGISYI